MTTNKPEPKKEVRPLERDVRALSDEVRLKLHLAGMDVKSEWERLEPQLERAASSAAIVTDEVFLDLKKRLLELKQRLAH
ncbi:MAG: hypothetical protein GQE15_02825 [Archangiaceae bacterium]|nr:hypothetical protein [Archangiaceae bacterium]